MPAFESLVFDEISENVCINDLIAYAEGLKDNDGVAIFADADFGWESPEGIPTEDDVPMLRIWSDSGQEIDDNNSNVLTYGKRTISLFFYFYAFGDVNIQAQRARFARHFLTHLSDPATLAAFNGGQTDKYWRIDFDSAIQIDHTQALKRVADYIVVQPPWYVTRIDIPVELFTDYAN